MLIQEKVSVERCDVDKHKWVMYAPDFHRRADAYGKLVIPFFCAKCGTRLRDDGTPANETHS